MDVYSSDWDFPVLLQSVTYNEKKKTVTSLEIHKVHLIQHDRVLLETCSFKQTKHSFSFSLRNLVMLCVIAAIKPATICLMRL